MATEPMSAAARAEIADAMSNPLDVARTVIVDDIRVCTSRMPTYGKFLTSVLGSSAETGVQDDEEWSDTREQAVATHERMVARVREALAIGEFASFAKECLK